MRAALEAQGVDSLYEHQAEAWDAAAHGEHVLHEYLHTKSIWMNTDF